MRALRRERAPAVGAPLRAPLPRATSTSAWVVDHPSDRRRDPEASARSSPRAARTWDGSWAPLAQLDAALASTPCSCSRRKRSASLSTAGRQTLAMPATRCSRPVPSGTALSMAPGTPARTAATSSSRHAPARATSSDRPAAAAVAAAANPTAPATSCVPLRRSRSCPPPSCWASSATPARTTSAPVPTGPPHLCEASVTRSAGAAASRTSSQLSAWAASVWSTARGARARTSSAISASGWMVPTSLLTSTTETSATSSSSAAGEGFEVDEAATVDADDAAPRRLHRVEHRVVLDRRAHHRAATRAEHPTHRQVVGLGAAAGEARSHRAGSRRPRPARRGLRRGRPEPRGRARGRPRGCRSRRAGAGTIAASASGRSGVVAAWSR